MANLFNMLKNAHKLKSQMGKVSEGLAGIVADGTAGKGAVTVRVDGQMKILSVEIAPELLARGDAVALGEMIRDAANQAREKAQKLAAEAMMSQLGGGIPGSF